MVLMYFRSIDTTSAFQPVRPSEYKQTEIQSWSGCFSALGKSNLVVLVERQKSEDNIHRVSENRLPFAHLNHGASFTYQQDNAIIHKSKLSIDFFNVEHMKLLDWPPKSPDLNLIENLWYIISRKVYTNGRQFDSVQSVNCVLNG